MVAEIGRAYGWRLRGKRLERLVDKVAPYLAEPDVTRPCIAATIITNYYRDSAAVALLQAERDAASAALWAAILEAARAVQGKASHVQVNQSEVQDRVTRRLKNRLARHNYQTSLRLLIARVVIEEVAASTSV